jgi:hypothetical protein
MNNMNSSDYGCEHCWPSAAEAALAAKSTLVRKKDLIDQSHFHAMIRACPHCAQRFVSVFTETIDWMDGDDPQYCTLMPITEMEAVDLVQQCDSLTEDKLDALARGRRSLHEDKPKGSASRVFWGTGLCAGLHD